MFVYLLEAVGSGRYKIGIAKNVRSRVSAMTSPFPIKIIHTFSVSDEKSARTAERLLHRAYKTKRRNGEWFDLDPVDVDDVCTITGIDGVVFIFSQEPAELKAHLLSLLPKGKDRPILGNTPLRSMRLSDKDWEGLQNKAEASGYRNVSELIRAVGNTVSVDNGVIAIKPGPLYIGREELIYIDVSPGKEQAPTDDPSYEKDFDWGA